MLCSNNLRRDANAAPAPAGRRFAAQLWEPWNIENGLQEDAMRVQQNTAALGAACFIEAAWVKRKKTSKKLGKDSER